MSLALGKAFISVLRANETLAKELGATTVSGTLQGARIFAIARSTEDENLDKIPYIIVEAQGITTEGSEDNYEETDTDTIDLLVVADTYANLVSLSQEVRETIEAGICTQTAVAVHDYTFSASAVSYDADKPCFFITLTYICSTDK